MTKLKQSGGFTLLEVLIVVAIIIIIAGIALPRFLGVSEQGRRARSAGDLRVIQTAVESYALNTNAAPGDDATAYTNFAGATPQIISSANDFIDQFNATANSNYAIKTKKDATSGKVFYVAGSAGPNGTVTVSIDDTTGNGKVKAQTDDIIVTNAGTVTRT